MDALVSGAEAWLSETGKIAATWLGDDPEETEAHVHMRHARQVAIALERGSTPPPAPTMAPRYEQRGEWDASAAEQSGVSDAEGGRSAAKSKRRWRERPPPGSPAARAECVPARAPAPRRGRNATAKRIGRCAMHLACGGAAAFTPRNAAQCSALLRSSGAALPLCADLHAAPPRRRRARLVSDFREVVPSARILSSDGAPQKPLFCELNAALTWLCSRALATSLQCRRGDGGAFP